MKTLQEVRELILFGSRTDWDTIARLVHGAIVDAVSEEREACSKLADEVWEKDFGRQRGLERVGDYIRARSK